MIKLKKILILLSFFLLLNIQNTTYCSSVYNYRQNYYNIKFNYIRKSYLNKANHFFNFINITNKISYNDVENIGKDEKVKKIKENNFIILSDKNIDLINKTVDNYSKIPDKLKNKFKEDGWEIIITDEHLGQKFHNSNKSVLATFVKKEKRIYLENRKGMEGAIIHEFGHFLDQIYSVKYSSKKEFKKIYQEEVDNFRKIVDTAIENTNTESEYFAEFFQEYILENNKLKEYCPLSYNYFVEIIKEFNSI